MNELNSVRYAEDALRIIACESNGDDVTYNEVISRYNPDVLDENPDIENLLSAFIGMSAYLIDCVAIAMTTSSELVIDSILLDLSDPSSQEAAS